MSSQSHLPTIETSRSTVSRSVNGLSLLVKVALSLLVVAMTVALVVVVSRSSAFGASAPGPTQQKCVPDGQSNPNLPPHNSLSTDADYCGVQPLEISRPGAVPIVPGVGQVVLDFYIEDDVFLAPNSAIIPPVNFYGDNRDYLQPGSPDPFAKPSRSRVEGVLNFDTGLATFHVSPSCSQAHEPQLGIPPWRTVKECHRPQDEGGGNDVSATTQPDGSIKISTKFTESNVVYPGICAIKNDINISSTASNLNVSVAGAQFPSLAIMHNGTVVAGYDGGKGASNALPKLCLYGIGRTTGFSTPIPRALPPTSLVNQAHGLCLDAAAQTLANDGGLVQLWNCVGDTNQNWVSVGSQIHNLANGKCLDANWSTDGTYGGLVQMWSCNGGPNQQWVRNGSGQYVNQAHGLCLDASWGTDGANGGKVELWQCNTGANQNWAAAGSPVQISTPSTYTSPPNGTVGVPYSFTFSATGGNGSYSWWLAGGSLPPGLSLSTSGTISGTPSAVSQGGPFTVDVSSAGQTAAKAFTIWANPGAPTSYQYYVVAPGGTLNERSAPATSATLDGTLPNGTAINIVCQTTGSTVSGSSIWDKLANGYYVSDYYTSTPNVGTWSPPIPQC